MVKFGGGGVVLFDMYVDGSWVFFGVGVVFDC